MNNLRLTWVYMAHIFLLSGVSISFLSTDLEYTWVFFLVPLCIIKIKIYISFCFFFFFNQLSITHINLGDSNRRAKIFLIFLKLIAWIWVYIATVELHVNSYRHSCKWPYLLKVASAPNCIFTSSPLKQPGLFFTVLWLAQSRGK